MAIPQCNSTLPIQASESVGRSLFTLNTNFNNLDIGLCELSSYLFGLEAFIKSLSAKDSSTVDMSFSVAGYFLSSDVKNNSLGTIKLGVDIPNTTKTFLKVPTLNNLIDTQVNDLINDQILAWNGTKWINTPLVDEIGAKILPELNDIALATPRENQVLQFNVLTSRWVNGPDQGLDSIPDGDYDDINVSNSGKNWTIRPDRVTPFELATHSVSTLEIDSSTITNNRFVDDTIQLAKCNFAVGEVNTGINLGTGPGKLFINKTETELNFRTIKPAGSVSFTFDNDTLNIDAPEPPIPPPPRAGNVGTGFALYKNIEDNYKLIFKTIRAGTGNIQVTPTGEDEITISRNQGNVGVSIIGYKNDGSLMSDDDIRARVSSIFLPEDFDEGTVCTVSVEYPNLSLPVSTTVSVPFELSYKLKVSTVCVGITGPRSCSASVALDWIDPAVVELTVETRPNKFKGTDNWAGNKNLQATVISSGTSSIVAPEPTVKTFRKTGSSWTLFA